MGKWAGKTGNRNAFSLMASPFSVLTVPLLLDPQALFKAEYAGSVGPAAILDYDAFGRELRSAGRASDIVPFH